MAYAKIVDGLVDTYPYTIEMLKNEFPRTSLPNNLDLVKRVPGGTFELADVEPSAIPSYDRNTHKVVEGAPVKNESNNWVQTWSVVELDAVEVAKTNQMLDTQNRAIRDRLLSESDVVIIRSIESGEAISEEVKAYRQALRDVPQQEGYPLSVTWPVDPNNSLVAPE